MSQSLCRVRTRQAGAGCRISRGFFCDPVLAARTAKVDRTDFECTTLARIPVPSVDGHQMDPAAWRQIVLTVQDLR
jgi:hypothetical protein